MADVGSARDRAIDLVVDELDDAEVLGAGTVPTAAWVVDRLLARPEVLRALAGVPAPDVVPPTHAELVLAIADPGSFLPRGDNYSESIPSWSGRAVQALLAHRAEEQP